MPNSLMKQKLGMTHATRDMSMPDATTNSMAGKGGTYHKPAKSHSMMPDMTTNSIKGASNVAHKKFPMNPRKIHGA